MKESVIMIIMNLCYFVLASCVHSDSLQQSDFRVSIQNFEERVSLPAGSDEIDQYGRYYRVENIQPNGENQQIVFFRYISRNQRPGIFIVPENEDLPRSPILDGGCITIDGAFELSSGELLAIECGPGR